MFTPQWIPKTHVAVKQGVGGRLQVDSNAAVPELVNGHILVRVMAVALNLTDYKLPLNFPSPGATAGTDFSGTVVALGPDIDAAQSRIKIGDRVCGNVFGSNPSDHATGAFAEYVSADADLVARIPDDMAWEEAAAVGGVGHSTVALALWTSCIALKGTPQRPYAGDDADRHVLVYGGSTATGTAAIQILRLYVSNTQDLYQIQLPQRVMPGLCFLTFSVLSSGYLPIAICSPHNFPLVRALGAVATFDYKSKTCGQDIRDYTNSELWVVLDCITDHLSTEISFAALGRAGGRYVHLEQLGDEGWAIAHRRKAVKTEFLMQYQAFGAPISLSESYELEARPDRREFARRWYESVEDLLRDGLLQHHPIQILKGGLDSVVSGLDEIKKGNLSAVKLVIPLGLKSSD